MSANPQSRLNISKKERQALRCAIDTLIPAIEKHSSPFWRRKATDLDVDEHILETIAILPKQARKEFVLLLKILASPLPGLLSLSWPGSFYSLSEQKREALLRRWACSPIAPLRIIFASLKRICTFVYYGSADQGTNPNWHSVGYPGPPKIAVKASVKETLSISEATEVIECHTLVIGSGAGGGVVAGTLSEGGRDVVVIDKGPYIAPSDRTNLEHEMISKLYESRGMQTNRDHSISLFAGSCLGGGTTVNWSVAWKPDASLRHEWASQHALPGLEGKAFSQCIEDVMRLTNVVDKVPYNAQSRKLISGSESLGFVAGPLPQNVKGCEHHHHEHCGFCLFGCKYGNKQDVNETFLHRAQKDGARIYAGVQAKKLHRKAGKITQVEATALDSKGVAKPIIIRAKHYVLAAGAIQTPALLLASGLSHSQLGRNLYVHPAMLVLGRYDEKIESWRGGMMTSHSEAAANLDNRGYGCKIEPTPLHTGLLAASLPWRSGEQHKQLMLSAPHYSGFAVITRDKFGGNVGIDRDGRPQINYRLHDYDRGHAMQGLAAAAAIHGAAGAEQVILGHHGGKTLEVKDYGKDKNRYLNSISELKWAANCFPLFSSHLMGTCRMGGNKAASPVNPEGRLWGTDNLYIADGSLFPSASGINPMITIQSLARYIALGILAAQ